MLGGFYKLAPEFYQPCFTERKQRLDIRQLAFELRFVQLWKPRRNESLRGIKKRIRLLSGPGSLSKSKMQSYCCLVSIVDGGKSAVCPLLLFKVVHFSPLGALRFSSPLWFSAVFFSYVPRAGSLSIYPAS